MGTKIRSEVSRKREYWLPKHRQLELVHFCLQYPEWMDRLDSLNGDSIGGRSVVKIPEKNGSVWKPVEEIVEERILLEEKIQMVESAARKAADDLYGYLLKGVTESVGYELLGVPCCREVYYRMYRRFFWLLDKTRH